MTRINLVPPSELCDKHLLAEYRELPRVFKLARADADIPPAYVLGTGHVTFFYDKLAYLVRRQMALVAECKRRGFNIAFDADDLVGANKNAKLYGDYEPTQQALALNRARIAERMANFKKPV